MTEQHENIAKTKQEIVNASWQPLKTAPRCGMIIELTADDADAMIVGPHYMSWDAEATSLFSMGKGLWVDHQGAYTWSDKNADGAPTQWRLCDLSIPAQPEPHPIGD